MRLDYAHLPIKLFKKDLKSLPKDRCSELLKKVPQEELMYEE